MNARYRLTVDNDGGAIYAKLTREDNGPAIHHGTERAALDNWLSATWGDRARVIRISAGVYECVWLGSVESMPPLAGVPAIVGTVRAPRERVTLLGIPVRIAA